MSEYDNPCIVEHRVLFAYKNSLVMLTVSAKLVQDGITEEVVFVKEQEFEEKSEAYEFAAEYMKKSAIEVARIANELRTKNPA